LDSGGNYNRDLFASTPLFVNFPPF
jgi:hypothetical protein